MSNSVLSHLRVAGIRAPLLAFCGSALLAGCASSEPAEPVVPAQPTSDSVNGSPDEWLAQLCTTQPQDRRANDTTAQRSWSTIAAATAVLEFS